MSLASALKTIAAYVVFGPPIGTLALISGIVLFSSNVWPHVPPSPGTSLASGVKEILVVFIGGYAFGFIPAASSGLAHAYARAHSFGRKQTVGLASACGAAAAAGTFNLGFPDLLWWDTWKLTAYPVAVALIAASCVGVLLTRAQTPNAT
ncbi:MAG: hypothetical protein ABI605_13900 [Rhizobacter sp.]